MYNLSFLYEFGKMDIEDKNELLINISLFGTTEAKALMLYKLKNKVNQSNCSFFLDILSFLVETTELTNKTEYIYKYIINITENIIDLIKTNSTEYYKIIILAIKIIKICESKIQVSNLIRKIIERIDNIDKQIVVRHMFGKLQNKITKTISEKTMNTILSIIMDEKEILIERYKIFLNNICYIPYITKISFDNILKISRKLNNLKSKIKSLSLRKILIEIITNYFDKQEIDILLNNFETIKNDIFLKHLLVNRLLREININPEILGDSKFISILSKLSFDKSSLIRSFLFNDEKLPLYIRVNSFKTRKYNVEMIKKYLL